MTLAPSASASVDRRPSPLRWGALRRRLFGISPDEARFERRGFQPGEPATQQRLEQIGRTFVGGYLAGLEAGGESLATRLARVPLEDRGFAYEGAAMATALLDLITPWPTRHFAGLIGGPGAPHAYMLHVGAGWALARLSRRLESVSLPFDPLLRWLALDGYGFHEGYFAWPRSIVARRRPRGIRGYAGRAFDQGLGRSLWFVECGDRERVERRIASFPEERRSDLWSGIGLAAAYAGGVPASTLTELCRASGQHRGDLAQGAAFAAKARQRAQNPAPHTELACEVFSGLTAAAAARVTDDALADIDRDAEVPAYEIWRRSIRRRVMAQAARNE